MAQSKPADALPQHWTDRLPPAWRALAQLARWDRPIGWRLLALPCLMGLALTRTQEGFWWIDLGYAALFALGAVAMRGAGCTYNDIVDRDIDAMVARTASRPLPSGAMSLRGAWIWLVAQCLVGLVVLLCLPRLAQWIALGAIPLVAAYPFMKRITWWPQAWLGIVFSWGALVAGAAVDNAIRLETVLLYAGCIAWTIAYDTIYALQDIEDDALVGVKSTARLFGDTWIPWTTGFYVGALFLWGAASWAAGAQWPTYLVLAGIGGGLIWPMLGSVKDGPTALAAFKHNALIGFGVALAFAMEPIWRTALPFLN
ncbi:MAG: 4-hydroxybenzoate octaprenyltransferase [Alphaproteobacteria bacterium]|nr:4-hydroxybenzoate octaprenyltransferase [Alphaproteobacteria bacterium]